MKIYHTLLKPFMSLIMSLTSSIKVNELNTKAMETIAHLNEILLSEKRKSAIPWASQVRIDKALLLILIDADSLGDKEAIQWLDSLEQTAVQCDIHLCSNRPFTQLSARLTTDAQSLVSRSTVRLHLHLVAKGANRADQALIEIGEAALKSAEHSAVIVCTQDRDLLPIINLWKRSKRAAFVAPLRLDDSGQYLIKRCQKQGISLIDRHLKALVI